VSTHIQVLLDRVVELKRKEAFVPSYQSQATKEECLGIAISNYCEWSSLIFKVFIAALEDANFHTEAEEVQNIYDRITAA